jgi:hypothetical protein
MSESWRPIVDAEHQGSIRAGDVAGLGPPPRAMTPRYEKYVLAAKPSPLGVVLVVFIAFALADALLVALVPSLKAVGSALTVVMIVAMVYAWRRAGRARTRLRDVFRNGVVRMARLEDTRQIPIRVKFRTVYRYVLRFDVDGRKVTLVSWNDALSLLQVGGLEEVLWYDGQPDEIVPAYLLA